MKGKIVRPKMFLKGLAFYIYVSESLMNQTTHFEDVSLDIGFPAQWLYANILASPRMKLNGDSRSSWPKVGMAPLAAHSCLITEPFLRHFLSLRDGVTLVFQRPFEGNGLQSSWEYEDHQWREKCAYVCTLLPWNPV